MKLSIRIPTITILISIFFSLPGLFAQETDTGDRLSFVRDLIDNNGLLLVWGQENDQNIYNIQQRIYNLDMTEPDTGERLNRNEIISDSVITGNRQIAVATGNFLGNHYKHFVAAWAGPEQSVTVSIPDIDPETLAWTQAERISIPGPLIDSGLQKIQLATGDFYGDDRSDEFVAAYTGADSTIHLKLYSFSPESLSPILQDSNQSEALFMIDFTRHDKWKIFTGDFNGNGYHEIALVFVKVVNGNDWTITTTIYSVGSDGSFNEETSLDFFDSPGYFVSEINIAGASGNFNQDPDHDFAVGFSLSDTENFNDPDTWIQVFDVQDDLSTISSSEDNRIDAGTFNINEMNPINVAAGDLNGNARDEVVLAGSGTSRIYTVTDQLVPEFKRSVGAPSFSTNSQGDEDYFLAVGDMNGSGSAEIVTAASDLQGFVGGTQSFEIMVISLNDSLNSSSTIAHRQNEVEVSSDAGSYRNFAIALGDFSGNRTRLGDPTHYTRTAVLQPSVVLNAPPVHYDILNTSVFDMSGCYPDQNCGFSSTYTETSSTEESVSVEFHEDWGASVGVELTAPGSKTKVTATYGEKFSNKSTQGQTTVISSSRTSEGDDWIYANTYDLDLYEYPVYEGENPDPIGYYAVSVPSNIRPLWIEGKDDEKLGNQYRPNHETGNILSYPSYESEADTLNIDGMVVIFPEQTVGATGNSTVSVEQSTFTENDVTESWEAGGSFEQSIGETADFYGLELGFHVNWGGSYNRGEILNQTVNVGSSTLMQADFGQIISEIGGSGTYYIEPFAYWSVNGALVLDYKVDIPEGNNFWRDNYDAPDVGFSMPWRYDQNKNLPLPDNNTDYLTRTRDIVLSEPDPSQGDDVRVAARIRNMGLEDLTLPTSVEFYLGDPASGGQFIGEAETAGAIPARSSVNVAVDWQIPGDLQLDNARIYAAISAESIPSGDIHDNNNVAWAPVISLGLSTSNTQSESTIPEKVALYDAYPNPFNPSATIEFSLPQLSNVRLEVYDVTGRRIALIMDEQRREGLHSVQFDASGLSTGIYFYRLTTEQFSETKKMTLIK